MNDMREAGYKMRIEELEAALRAIGSACDEPLSYGRSNLANKIAAIVASTALHPKSDQ